MCPCLSLPIDNNPTNLTLDSHSPGIRIVMFRVQFLAQGFGFLEYLSVVRVPDSGVELGWIGGDGMWVVRGGADNCVVVDPRVHEDAACEGAFVVFVYSA